MLDAINAIVDFINMIIGTVTDFISYSKVLSGFVSLGSGFINSLLVYIPSQFMPFAIITVVLSVVMFVVGRTNNA